MTNRRTRAKKALGPMAEALSGLKSTLTKNEAWERGGDAYIRRFNRRDRDRLREKGFIKPDLGCTVMVKNEETGKWEIK